MENYYYCKNNKELIILEPEKEINFPWWKRYIGRAIIPDLYYEYFLYNGYSPEVEEYIRDDIILNLEPEVDENEHIISIDFYKVQELSYGHGRPQTDDRRILKSDISLFQSILDAVTIDPVDGEYKSLCERLSAVSELPGGYSVKAVSETGVELLDQEGKKHKLAKKKIIRGLELSHFYLDVLFEEKTLLDNPKYFAINDIPLYLAVFSLVDCSQYYKYDELNIKAGIRTGRLDIDEGCKKLIQAVKTNDLSMAQQYCVYASFEYRWSSDIERKPLVLAACNGNVEMMELLLRHGACSTENCGGIRDVPFISPLHIAVKDQNYRMIELLAKYGGCGKLQTGSFAGKYKYDTIYELIRSSGDVHALSLIMHIAKDEPDFPPFAVGAMKGSFDELVKEILAIKYGTIMWPCESIKEALLRSRDLCIAMLKQGSEFETLQYLMDIDDFELFKICLDRISNSNIPKVMKNGNSLERVFEHDVKWYEALRDAFGAEGRCGATGVVYRLFKNEHYDELNDFCNKFDVPIPVYLFDLYSPHFPLDESLKKFLDYTVDHLDYREDPENDGSWYSTTDSHFWSFANTLYRGGYDDSCKRCLQKYPLMFTRDRDHFKSVMQFLDRSDELFECALRVKKENLDKNSIWHIRNMLWDLTIYSHDNLLNTATDIAQNYIEKRIKRIRLILSVFPLEEMEEVYSSMKNDIRHFKELIEEKGLTEILFEA